MGSKQGEMGGGGSITSWNGVEPHEIIEASSSLIVGDSSLASWPCGAGDMASSHYITQRERERERKGGEGVNLSGVQPKEGISSHSAVRERFWGHKSVEILFHRVTCLLK